MKTMTDSLHPNWQIPAFECRELLPRQQKYALVIPVINEGQRIQRQLALINDAGFAVDVIIADGGSTDGSLSESILSETNVNTVLTIKSTGRLSSQLRMAYSWCLEKGYEGIITVDGNGKDDMSGIPRFIDKLEQGFDYVQGSRYQNNGVAENTPLERTLANRLIHAPLLSIAAYRRYTDTTNGFRAYSAKYLLDADVAPFRDEFSNYELLFYLTIRASQLGYNTCEVPVTRRYPGKGIETPTKIGGFAGKLDMLLQTMKVACGSYLPVKKDAQSIKPTSIEVILGFLIFIPLFLLASRYNFPHDNHGQEIPAILQMCGTPIFTNDFAVESFTKFGPRFFYNHLICAFSLTGFSIPATYLTLQILSIGSVATALLVLARNLFNRTDASDGVSPLWINAAFVLLCLLPASLWDAPIMPEMSIPGSYAMGIVAWGLVAAAAKRWVMAYALFGLGAMFQFLVGFIPGLLLLPVAFISLVASNRIKDVLPVLFFWGAGLGAVYVPMTFSPSVPIQVLSSGQSVMEFFGQIRVPHHWLPSHAPWWHWPNVVAYYVVALTLLSSSFQQHKIRTLVPFFSLILFLVGVCLVSNYIFVELYFVDVVGKLQLQRALPFGRIVLLLVLCIHVSLLWQNGWKSLSVGLLISPFFEFGGLMQLVLVYRYMSLTNQGERSTEPKSEIILVSLLVLLVGLVSSVFDSNLLIGRLTYLILIGVPLAIIFLIARYWLDLLSPTRLSILGVVFAGFAVFLFSGNMRSTSQAMTGNVWNYDRPVSTVHEHLAVLTQQVTSPGELVLIPPSKEFALFTLYSQRPVYFNWKNIPYDEGNISQWATRLETLIGSLPITEIGNGDLRRGFAAIPAADIRILARESGATIIVSHLQWHQFSETELIGRYGN